MWKSNTKRYLVLAAVLLTAITTRSFAGEAELLAVLRSEASIQEKSAACRQLARIATKEAIPTLATLLGDEKLSHMARYALEPIKDPAVDDALRNALGKVEGQPRLGVIGSLGVRRDAKAVDALAKLLDEADTAEAAARALGSIGVPAAAKALENALADSSGASQRAIGEGLLRCAEVRAADGDETASQAIYDRLRGLATVPPHIRAAAVRGAIVVRGKDGVPLMLEAIRGSDYGLAAVAVRAAMESPAPEIGDALVAELPKASPERQGLLILALADRGDSRILPAVLAIAQNNDGQLRLLAFRALKRVGDASCVPALLDAAVGADDEVSRAAIRSLESLQDSSIDDQLLQRLSGAQGKMRRVLVELAGLRRIAAATPTLWSAADDADPAIRIAALDSLGATIETAELPRLIARLSDTNDGQEAAALDKALREVCLRAKDREAVAAQLAKALTTANGSAKGRILETLNIVGGTTALQAAAAAARSSDEGLRDAASRVLGKWKSADAAPVLLDLHAASTDGRIKIRAMRAYIRIARQFDMPDDQRATMCRTALKTAERDADRRLVLEVLLRYPNEESQAIALEAAKDPALKEPAMLIVMGMASQGINRAELGKALAQAGHKPVKLEIVKAEYGAGKKVKDVTGTLRKYTKGCRIIFLPKTTYNASFGGDPAPGISKQLKIQYRVDDKPGEVSLSENAIIVLPLPK